MSFLVLSESPTTVSKISNHLYDISTINQSLVNDIMQKTHEQRVEMIEESKRPDIYRISIWYKYYWNISRGQLDKHKYFESFFNLYFSLYYLVIVRIWKKSEIKSPTEKEIREKIPSIKDTVNQLKLVSPTDSDYINLKENNSILHEICPVFVAKKNNIHYFFYYDKLESFVKREFPKKITILNEPYIFSVSLIHTINHIINHLVLENHQEKKERVLQHTINDSFLYPIYAIDENLLKEMMKTDNNSGVITLFENMKI